jgi:hypothetical protein
VPNNLAGGVVDNGVGYIVAVSDVDRLPVFNAANEIAQNETQIQNAAEKLKDDGFKPAHACSA